MISTKGRYALRILVDIAEHQGDGYVPLKESADRQEISEKYLESIVSTLVKYDFIDGKYLYNRCHLIAYQLTGQNDNEQNLITGTRCLNVEGMLPFENQVAQYIRSTGNHVLYRVTPVFRGRELLCRGVRMEARSVEDGGRGVSFHVFVFNVQPGVEIDYADGESRLAEAGDP